MLVNLRNMDQPRDAFHDLAQALIALSVFGGCLPVFRCQQLDGLGQRFMPCLQLFEGHM
jgi:hypothetical protein